MTATADHRRLKCSCGEAWSHPAVRLLMGDAFRPGGAQLTGELLDTLSLQPGQRVLDVGCGAGRTLELLDERGVTAIGVDYSVPLAEESSSRALAAAADAEALPFVSGAFDVVLMECVLSLFPDKAAALRSAAASLVPWGTLLGSDVAVEEELPEPLGSILGWVGCVGGALPWRRYEELLHDAGFDVRRVDDRKGDVASFITKIRRRVALFQGALAVGLITENDVPSELSLRALRPGQPLAQLADVVFDQATAAADSGVLRYLAFAAQKRDAR